ncbi:MAG: DUF1392 domain-containing protein [Mojavia pulchra JT2-VF2]|jgi:hypothetical protein|uniref:DUF1392 domain-containing protein n=1 Tax=Mojavia pulchra JT2-VF2 TaxID=287848 RepID=A0A951Q459_9NOST|nr:DUF1392 domain-containing protein [Mojavia pulchra JT2-VF2]
MEAITELEKCWFLSPPWGQEIPPVEVNLLEKVYLKGLRTFGYCCGVQWYRDSWNYIIEIKDDVIHATKHQILGTGRLKDTNLKKPTFMLGECVLLSSCDRPTKQRLVLGIGLVHTSWFYLVEVVSPAIPQPNTMPSRFCLVREEDLVRVNV